MNEFVGYTVTRRAEDLVAFIVEANAAYRALEQAVKLVDEKTLDLKKDWYPRELAFWSEILRTLIPGIREATDLCLYLFSRKRSGGIPTPIIICCTSIAYTCSLSHIDAKIEEAGILLTAYLCTPESKSAESRIRERQRMLHALQQLSKAVHEALNEGRAKLKTAEHDQREMYRPKHPGPQHRPACLHMVVVEADQREAGENDE